MKLVTETIESGEEVSRYRMSLRFAPFILVNVIILNGLVTCYRSGMKRLTGYGELTDLEPFPFACRRVSIVELCNGSHPINQSLICSGRTVQCSWWMDEWRIE